ncbi:MAG: ankyrin repeat domain-containing protein [Pseudomonadota bacterium]
MSQADLVQKLMFDVILGGDVQGLKSIIKEHPDVLLENWNTGDSFLHLAALKGQDSLCSALIDAGIDVDRAGSAGATPLSEAASYGKRSTVELLLKRGASVDGLHWSVSTPLMNAAVDGHLEIAKALVDAGAEINREHLRLPQTALDFAVFYSVKNTGQHAVAELLRANGAIRPYTEKHDWSGRLGQSYIEHIERALGGFVNPIAIPGSAAAVTVPYAIYRARIPKKYDYQLLFTVGLACFGSEVAVCLSSNWPLNLSALQQPRYWHPFMLLNDLSSQLAGGKKLSHGMKVEASPVPSDGYSSNEASAGWILASHDVLEKERDGDSNIGRTLLMFPIQAKGKKLPSTSSIDLAQDASRAKWAKLALPTPAQ